MPKITSDNITTYGSDDVTDYCGTDIPNDFTHVNQLFFETFADDMNDLKDDLNLQISTHIGLNNFSDLDLDLSNTTLNHYDIINGFEPLNDTSKIQITATFDTTINTQYPLDSVEVSLVYNNKNELKLFDSFPSSHHFVNTLNSTLNDLWSLELNNIIDNQIIFNDCKTNDSLNQFYSDFYIGELDSQRTDSAYRYSSLVNLYDENYLVYNQDSLKHIYTNGKDLFDQETYQSMFISYRDLDSNNNLGDDKVSYLSRYFSVFSNDANNDKFEFKFLKYFKPDCSSLDSLECFKQDCRDTLLLEYEDIRNNWDNAFILLPGLENSPDLILFPTNDSLLTFLSGSTNFTDEFGYFGLDNTGYLTYNTIQSAVGYSSDTTYRIFKLIDIDTNETVAHINTQTFIMDPVVNADVFTIDTNNNFQLALSSHVIPTGGSGSTTFINTTIPSLPYFVNFEVDNVIKAVSQTFKYPDINPNSIPDKEVFSDKTYLYRKDRQYSNSESYASTGIIENFNTYYHRTDDVNNPNWFRVNKNSKVDTEGKIYESIDLKDIKSTVVYDTLNRQRVISTNAGFNDIYFNDFEFPNWGLTLATSTNYSHSGYKSEVIESNHPVTSPNHFFPINDIKLTENILDQGIVLKFWAKVDNTNGCFSDYEDVAITLDYFFNSSSPVSYGHLIPISKSGEWYLYEVDFPTSFFSGYTSSDVISFQIKNALSSCAPLGLVSIYLDDILIKPIYSFSECYVYDFYSNRISATLDNNHFANIIQYNEKGIPVRNIVETYQGLKTASESQINTPRSERPNPEPEPQMIMNQVESTKSNLRIGATEIIEFKKNTPKEQQVDAKFNILDIKISQDSSNIKYFNVEDDLKLDSLDKFESPIEDKFNELEEVEIPDSLRTDPSLRYRKEIDKYPSSTDSLDIDYEKRYKQYEQIESLKKEVIEKEIEK